MKEGRCQMTPRNQAMKGKGLKQSKALAKKNLKKKY